MQLLRNLMEALHILKGNNITKEYEHQVQVVIAGDDTVNNTCPHGWNGPRSGR